MQLFSFLFFDLDIINSAFRWSPSEARNSIVVGFKIFFAVFPKYLQYFLHYSDVCHSDEILKRQITFLTHSMCLTHIVLALKLVFQMCRVSFRKKTNYV
jgi:hypothetical protein